MAERKFGNRICIDLDGLLARADGWQGHAHIGKAHPKAAWFCGEVQKIAPVCILTARLSSGALKAAGAPEKRMVAQRIRNWLDTNGIPYDEVRVGKEGKPTAIGYVDDRGVECDPWANPADFDRALARLKDLADRPI